MKQTNKTKIKKTYKYPKETNKKEKNKENKKKQKKFK